MSHSLEELDAVLSRANLIYSAEQVAQAIDTMALQLNERLKESQPLLLCVMNGGLVFTGYLLTRLNCFPEVDYIHATRYRNKTSGSTLDWRAHPHNDLKNRTVLILDDILDEGITLKAIIDYCYEQGAKEVLSAVLVQKKHDRCIDGVKSDYVGLEVEDKYVFGFGMDYRSQLRHLDGIYALSE
ncbi:MAG: hypoxanthine-guanine phosphoribosyltransferase [Gammaproteobacteria bacterium]|nr:hypoxanthine-guanine phosphoribosyltransferase [Gammaproteobacteria bacterium]MCW8923372.1 hypoxanthine-guanine phosphoribosyltransferase [Gammaproteobacteria bacterium]